MRDVNGISPNENAFFEKLMRDVIGISPCKSASLLDVIGISPYLQTKYKNILKCTKSRQKQL